MTSTVFLSKTNVFFFPILIKKKKTKPEFFLEINRYIGNKRWQGHLLKPFTWLQLAFMFETFRFFLGFLN